MAQKLGSEISLEALLAYPILTHARNTRPFADVERHVRQAGRILQRLIPSNNLAACMRMTAQGMGVATLLEAMVAAELDAGTLVRLDYAWVPEPLTFHACYDAERAPRYVAIAADLARQAAGGFVRRDDKKTL